ncbi:unnamed protein product, partial [Brassica oleracea var. botrytis]
FSDLTYLFLSIDNLSSHFLFFLFLEFISSVFVLNHLTSYNTHYSSQIDISLSHS